MAHVFHQQARRMLLPLAAEFVRWPRLFSCANVTVLAACFASVITSLRCRITQRQFLVVPMSHEPPLCLLWWLMVAVVNAESAPPSGVVICYVLSERKGDKSLNRPFRGALGVERPRALGRAESMAVSGEVTAASVQMKSTLVARAVVAQKFLGQRCRSRTLAQILSTGPDSSRARSRPDDWPPQLF